MSEHYDLMIRGGTLIDGTGAPERRGDLGVRDGHIVAIGEVSGTADKTIEADGRIVSPGFVDIHTHYDAQIFWDRMLTISPWHGVTSVVMGNCGFGIAPTRKPDRDLILRTLENVEGMSLEALHAGIGEDWPFETFPEYLDVIESRGNAINVGALIGHTPVRMYVMARNPRKGKRPKTRSRRCVPSSQMDSAPGPLASRPPRLPRTSATRGGPYRAERRHSMKSKAWQVLCGIPASG